MIGKSIEFSLVDSKRRCKGMYFATVVSEKLYPRIQTTTHMSPELNKYKWPLNVLS